MTRDQDRANRDIFKGIDDELLATLETYEKKQTLEAKIVYEANVIAFLVELKLLIEKGNTHAREWMDANITRRVKYFYTSVKFPPHYLLYSFFGAGGVSYGPGKNW